MRRRRPSQTTSADATKRRAEVEVRIRLYQQTVHQDAGQTAFQTMILGLEGEDQGEMLRNIFVSSCIFMETEDAEGCVDGIERKVSNLNAQILFVRRNTTHA
jgi:hypothetical protein